MPCTRLPHTPLCKSMHPVAASFFRRRPRLLTSAGLPLRRFEGDRVVETAAQPGLPSLNTADPRYVEVETCMRAARYLLQSMTSCALGYDAGAGYFSAFLAAMPVAPQCPDARRFLCENMLEPSVSESSAEMWDILHSSLFLTPDVLTALVGVSSVLGLVLTFLALPGLASRMTWSRGAPKLTEEAVAEQEAALRRELEDQLLSARRDRTKDAPAHGMREEPRADKAACDEGEHPTAEEQDDPAPPLSRGQGLMGASPEAFASTRAAPAPPLMASVVSALNWFLSTRLVRCSLTTSHLSLTAVVAVFFFLVISVLLFGLLTAGFICVCLILTEEWCFDHSIQTALPEAVVAATAALAASTAAAGRPLASERLADVLAAVALALGLLSVALGLRSSIRWNVSHHRLSYVVGMAVADLAKVGSYVGVYRLWLAIRALHVSEQATPQPLLGSGFMPSHRAPRSGLVTSGQLNAPLRQLVRNMTVAELKTRALAGSWRHALQKWRRAVGDWLGLHGGASLAWLDAAVFLLVYGFLFGLSDRINLALIALVGLYTTLLMLHELEREIQFCVLGDAPGLAASGWDRGLAHFRGGGERVRAARWLWWAFAVRLLSIITTAILEPMCLQQPCVVHQNACPLPYHLNHLSTGYSLDFATVALLAAGAIALIVDEHRRSPRSHSAGEGAGGAGGHTAQGSVGVDAGGGSP